MEYKFERGEIVRIKNTPLIGKITLRSPFFLIDDNLQVTPDGKIYIIRPIPESELFIGAKEEYLERLSSATLEELTR